MTMMKTNLSALLPPDSRALYIGDEEIRSIMSNHMQISQPILATATAMVSERLESGEFEMIRMVYALLHRYHGLVTDIQGALGLADNGLDDVVSQVVTLRNDCSQAIANSEALRASNTGVISDGECVIMRSAVWERLLGLLANEYSWSEADVVNMIGDGGIYERNNQ